MNMPGNPTPLVIALCIYIASAGFAHGQDTGVQTFPKQDIPEIEISIDQLIDALDAKDVHIRVSSAEELGRRGDRRAVSHLIRSLQDKDWHVRNAAALSLGMLQDPRALQPLLSALKDRKSKVQGSVREALSSIMEEMKKRNDVEPILALIENEDSDVRMIAVTSLKGIKDEKVPKALVNLLDDQNESVHDTTMEALKEMGPDAVIPLIESFTMNDMSIWIPAVRLLGEIGDNRAVEPLILALKHPARILQYEAAKALGKINDPRAVEPLIQALSDNDTVVREAAAQSLTEIGKPAVEPLIEALGERDLYVLTSATMILGTIGDVRAVEPLVDLLRTEALEHRSWMLRTELARALGKIKDPRANDALNILASDIDDEVRETALWALKEIEQGESR